MEYLQGYYVDNIEFATQLLHVARIDKEDKDQRVYYVWMNTFDIFDDLIGCEACCIMQETLLVQKKQTKYQILNYCTPVQLCDTNRTSAIKNFYKIDEKYYRNLLKSRANDMIRNLESLVKW